MSRIFKINLLLILPLLIGSLSTCSKDNPPPVPKASINLLTALPNEVIESSGLMKVNNLLYSHNDSDNAPWLFQVSESAAEVNHQLFIQAATNMDWEDLAKDDSNLYIADTGNNFGTRQPLSIYLLPQMALNADTAVAEAIHFTYPDQSNFTPRLGAHNFDCEALIAFQDSLYIFTKNHTDQQTKVYALPKQAGEYSARLCGQFDVEGLITAAALDNTSGLLCLLGYEQGATSTTYRPFIWLFYDYSNTEFFSGKQVRVELDSEEQLEGMCFSGNGQFLLSGESENGGTPHLYIFDSKPWIQ